MIANKMDGLKITKDGFVWKTVTYEQAKAIWYMELDELYRLYDDDSEAAIETIAGLNDAIKRGIQIGVEVGFIKDLEEKWQKIKEQDK